MPRPDPATHFSLAVTGRTDFQNSDPRAEYKPIFGRHLKLPDATLVYPRTFTRATPTLPVGEQRTFNPRLRVRSVEEFIELMNNLTLPNPMIRDVIVPANQAPAGAGEDRAPRLGAHAAGETPVHLASPISRSSICASAQSANGAAPIRAHRTVPTRLCRRASSLAACCTNSATLRRSRWRRGKTRLQFEFSA